MSSNSRVVCVGGAHFDIKARGLNPLVLYSSNPVSSFSSLGGVARNVAENLARLDVPVSMVSRVGQDQSGEFIRESLKALKVDISAISSSHRFPTATYTALLNPNGDMLIALADMAIYDEMTPEVVRHFLPTVEDSSFLVMDTNLSQDTLMFLAQSSPHSAQKWVIPVSIPKIYGLKPVVPFLTGVILNSEELSALVQKSVVDSNELTSAANELLQMGLSTVIVTRGGEGVFLASQQGNTWFEVKKKTQNRDVTGAGDSFAAGTIFGLHRGASLAESIQYGLATASLTLQTDATVNSQLNLQSLLMSKKEI